LQETTTWQDVIMPPRRHGPSPDHHFRADDELYVPAKAKAEREGRSLSWVIRQGLKLYLRDELPLADPGDGENPPPPGTGSSG
jgi:hypothetical protein